MLKHIVRLSVLVLLAFGFYTCQSETKPVVKETKKKAPLNPNGDSELALLMRDMFDDAMAMKTAYEKGEDYHSDIEFETILTAEATEPEKAASAEFQAYGAGYIEIMKQLESGESGSSMVYFDALRNNCLSCHQALCPGPIVKIEKLF